MKMKRTKKTKKSSCYGHFSMIGRVMWPDVVTWQRVKQLMPTVPKDSSSSNSSNGFGITSSEASKHRTPRAPSALGNSQAGRQLRFPNLSSLRIEPFSPEA